MKRIKLVKVATKTKESYGDDSYHDLDFSYICERSDIWVEISDEDYWDLKRYLPVEYVIVEEVSKDEIVNNINLAIAKAKKHKEDEEQRRLREEKRKEETKKKAELRKEAKLLEKLKKKGYIVEKES